MTQPQHTFTPPTLDGKVLTLDQMAMVGLESQAGIAVPGQPPRCYRCGQVAAWNAAVRLDAGGHTVGFALFFHCVEHRPAGGALMLPYCLERAISVVVPPPSSSWAVVNGLPEPPQAGLPPLDAPPRLG